MIKAEAPATETTQPQAEAKSKPASQGSGLGMKIGTGPGLIIIVVVSALGIWLKSGDNSDTSEVQRVQQARDAASNGQREAIQLAINQRRVLIGMTAAQAREAWGNPSSINRTESAYGAREQWVYGIGEYVYLRNDVVESVQTSRKQR